MRFRTGRINSNKKNQPAKPINVQCLFRKYTISLLCVSYQVYVLFRGYSIVCVILYFLAIFFVVVFFSHFFFFTSFLSYTHTHSHSSLSRSLSRFLALDHTHSSLHSLDWSFRRCCCCIIIITFVPLCSKLFGLSPIYIVQ